MKKELKIDQKEKLSPDKPLKETNLSFLEESKDSTSIQNDLISPGKIYANEDQVKEENEILKQKELDDKILNTLEMQEKRELCEDEKKERIEILLQNIDEIDYNIILTEQKIDELAAVIFFISIVKSF